MNKYEALQELGLDDKEIQVYVALLELGQGKVKEISWKAGVERTSVYDVLNELIKKGLVGFSVIAKKRVYFALEPEKIAVWLDEKSARIKKIIPELQAIYNLHPIKPKVRFFEGRAGVRQVLEDTLTSKKKQLFAILSMYEIFEFVGEEYMEDYVRRRIKAGVHLKVIRSYQKEVLKGQVIRWPSDPTALRELRFAPAEFVFSMNQYIYDNKVTLISSRQEGFGLIVESQELSDMQRNLFSALWQIARP